MDFEIQDELAELASIAFLLSGEENARLILERITSKDFVSYDGGLRLIVAAAETLLLEGQTITYMSLRDRLERTSSPGATNALEKIGGEKGLYKITKTFQVKEGLITFRETDDKVFAAPATEIAIIVKERTNRRVLNEKLQKLVGDLAKGTTTSANVLLELAETVSSSETMQSDMPGRSGMDDYERVVDRINRLSSNERIGIPTGFSQFDEETGGIKGNDYIVIGAVDKQCKSQLGLSLVNASARFGYPAAIISMEMSRDLINMRRISMNSGETVPFNKLIGARDRMTPYERRMALEVWDSIAKDPLYICDELNTAREIIPTIERYIRRFGVRLFLIDYFQKVEGEGKQEEILSNFSKQLANICLRYNYLDVGMIVVVQHNDEGARFQRIYGTASNQFAYGSKQPNKDATYKTTISMEPERFECDCPEQKIAREVMVGNSLKTFKVERWDSRPVNNICPDCEAAGRDPFVRLLNPQRRGRWTVEGSRNTRAGWYVPLLFNGTYMTLEEARPNGEQQPQQAAPPEDDSFFS